MAPSSQPQYVSHGHPAKRNGVHDPAITAVHEAGIQIQGWKKAWHFARPFISGTVIGIFWLIHILYSNGWFVSPAKTTDVTAAQHKQEITNLELKTDIAAANKAIENQGQQINSLVTFSNDMRLTMGEIKGLLANPSSPPAIPASPQSVQKHKTQMCSGLFCLRPR